MIIWEEVRDNHTFGFYKEHKFCIRLNREKKVTGLYYMTNTNKKWVPEDDDEEKLENMKIIAEFILEQKLMKKI